MVLENTLHAVYAEALLLVELDQIFVGNYSGTPLSRTVSARDVLRVGDTFCLNFPSK
jgi:hypothetical protein